jgi:hypothetical protein
VKAKPIKRRDGIKRQFARAAQSNTDRAWQLAMYGRDLSGVEEIVFDYLYAKECGSFELDRQAKANAFSELLVDTLKRGDHKREKEIKRAVRNFRHSKHVDSARIAMLLLKEVQTPPTPKPGWRMTGQSYPILSVKKITTMAFPRRNHPSLSDKQYEAVLASHEKTVRGLAKQIGVRLPDGGRPRKNLDK